MFLWVVVVNRGVAFVGARAARLSRSSGPGWRDCRVRRGQVGAIVKFDASVQPKGPDAARFSRRPLWRVDFA